MSYEKTQIFFRICEGIAKNKKQLIKVIYFKILMWYTFYLVFTIILKYNDKINREFY